MLFSDLVVLFFNFLEKFLPIIWFTLIYALLHLFDSFGLNSMYVVDTWSRVNLSDTILNWFNFYWTSNLYLSITFFTILLFIILTFQYISTSVYTLLILVLVFWSFENTSFISMNISFLVLDLTNSEVNVLLLNTLNKYHPLILYFSSFTLILLILLTLNWSIYTRLFFLRVQMQGFYKQLIQTLLLVFIALLMGSWWALQEGTWGGWWNWDASEVLGLLVLLVTLVETHFSSTYYSFLKKNERLGILITLLGMSYFFIQLNFELTSHSFGTRFNYFFNNHLFFLQSIGLLGIFFFIMLNTFYIHRTSLISIRTLYNLHLIQEFFQWILLWYLGVLLILLVIVSFNPLLNYFLWQFFKINSFNGVISIEFITSLLVSIIWLNFYKHSKLYSTMITLPIFCTNINPLHLVNLAFFKKVSTFTSLHFSIILFLVTNLIFGYTQLAYNWTGTYPWILTAVGSCTTYTSHLFTCHNFFLYQTSSYFTVSSLHFNNFNTFYKGNALNLNPFLLITTTESVFTCFFTGHLSTKNNLFLELPSFTLIADLTFLLICFLVLFLFCKAKFENLVL